MPEEKEKSKGISLRKKSKSKRLVISAPKAQPPNAPAVPSTIRETKEKSSAGASHIRPQTNEKTSDLVKRRYSTRFTQLPKDIDGSVPAIPALPSALDQFNRPGSKGRETPTRRGISVDTNALRDPRLEAEKYVASILVDASTEDIDTYRGNLRKLQTRASVDLQQNVYQNRTQFIKISKEAEKLKGEMRMLRGLMAELKTNTNTMAAASDDSVTFGEPSFGASASTVAARKQSRRTSVANLEAMWNTQLQSLWKNVEGSQKYLPAVPGRHIVKESGNWIELDAATWKPRRMMHIFLLNDHLLVASRKKKRIVDQSANGSPGAKQQQAVPSKLVAERCFPLQDIQLLDLSSSTTTNQSSSSRRERETSHQAGDALSIRSGSESFTYRNDRDTSEKASLLLAFRKTLEELRRSMRSMSVSPIAPQSPSAAAQKVVSSLNYFASRDPTLLATNPSLLDRLSPASTANRGSSTPQVMIDVDGKQHSLRWVESQIDELDMSISLQRIPSAVSSITSLRRLAASLKSPTQVMARHLITLKLDERAARLADLVTARLIESHASRSAVVENVSALNKLGFEDRAREAFLEARTKILEKRTRQSPLGKSLEAYVFSQAYIVFTLVRNTLVVYQAAFPQQGGMSAVVKWARERVEGFNRFLENQLPESGTEEREECLEIARRHASVLRDVGVDFGGLIWEGGDMGRVGGGVEGQERREGEGVGLGLA